jgi:hypothetical protein
MATKCRPYHSTDRTDPRVYHDYRDCPDGEQIRRENLASGTGSLPRCGRCNLMG